VPPALLLALLEPVIQLLIQPKQMDSHLTEQPAFRELFLVVIAADAAFARNAADQSGFLVRFARGNLARLQTFDWVTLGM
jgi:hypothetical protein